MTDAYHIALPSLDEMLSSLLLIEEGEHEFSGADEGVQELRQHFFSGNATLYLFEPCLEWAAAAPGSPDCARVY